MSWDYLEAHKTENIWMSRNSDMNAKKEIKWNVKIKHAQGIQEHKMK